MNFSIHTPQEHSCGHISAITSVVCNLRSCLRSGELGEGAELSEEVKQSLESSLVRACNRLDALLDDATRWQAPSDLIPLVVKSFSIDNKLKEFQAQLNALQLEELLRRREFIQKLGAEALEEAEIVSPGEPEKKRKRKAK